MPSQLIHMPKHEKQFAVLCLFDYMATTGFATVSTNIIAEMKRRFKTQMMLDIVAINLFAEKPIWEDETTQVIPIHPNEKINDPFGRHTFLRLLNFGDYDGIFIIQDPGTAVGMMPNLVEVAANRRKAHKKAFKSLFYFPIDSVPLDIFFNKNRDYNLDFFDRLVTYTEYGRREILKKAPWLQGKLWVIPHGINPKHFYPMETPDIEAFRASYFGPHAGKTIITNVNRNQFRKDIPCCMLALRQMMQDNPQMKGRLFLYLHMHPCDHMGWDLIQVGEQLGLVLGEDYGFPAEEEYNAGASIDKMRSIYNASNWYLTTTTGEGWGLGVTEAMACCLQVIGPNHTSLSEIGDGGRRMHMLNEFYPYCDRWDSVIREQCSYWEVADLLAKLLAPRSDDQMAERFKIIGNAQEYVETLFWPSICDKWAMLFRELFIP